MRDNFEKEGGASAFMMGEEQEEETKVCKRVRKRRRRRRRACRSRQENMTSKLKRLCWPITPTWRRSRRRAWRS